VSGEGPKGLTERSDETLSTLEADIADGMHRMYQTGQRDMVELLLDGLGRLHEQAPEVGFNVAAEFVRMVANGLMEDTFADALGRI